METSSGGSAQSQIGCRWLGSVSREDGLVDELAGAAPCRLMPQYPHRDRPACLDA